MKIRPLADVQIFVSGQNKNCGIELFDSWAGAEAGLMNHLMDFHRLQGEHLCGHCHRLLSTLKKLKSHNESCTKTNPTPPLERM